MRILAREEALDVISEDYCVLIGEGLYLCGLDYLLVKGYVLGSVADYVFGFVGDYVPVLNVQCEKYLMYYGMPKVLDHPTFYIEGWRRATTNDTVVIYSCVDDVMEFYEVESFVFHRVPLSMFGFGSWEVYRVLVGIMQSKNIYILKYFY
jgi:hypothetical protein